METKLELKSELNQGIGIEGLGKLPQNVVSEDICSSPRESSLEDIIIQAPEDLNTEEQAKRILKEFNKGIKEAESCFVSSRIRGNQIDPGKFVLGIRNNTAELHGPSGRQVARKLLVTPGQFTKIIKTKINQNDKFYGDCGRYVLNVPAGEYALATSGNKPLIYGAGCHVIHDPNLKTDIQFVSQSDLYIQHSTIHLLRIPVGKYVNIKMGSEFFILRGRSSPYIFNNPLIEIVNQNNNGGYFIDQSESYIHNGPKHILRVPVGKYAKIKIGSEFYILQGRSEAYLFDNPLVEVFRQQNGDYFIDQSESYIQYGSKHILRVPEGKIAKIWLGSEAILLNAQKEPYVFDNPLFRIEKNRDQLFFDAAERLIKHGSIKRVIPYTGEVAITYDNGELVVLKPQGQKPYLITSPTHDVKEFLPVGIETLIFPSEETKKQRLAENAKSTADEISYECFTTRDSLKIGVKLLVAFRIKDPEKAFKILINKEGILKHIENVTTVDMGKAIQKCSSQEFLNFYQTKPLKETKDLLTDRVEPKPLMHYQDDVKADLQRDLEEYGIELVRLNVETPKILDQQIANEMAKVAIQSAQSNAEESTMDQKFRIAKRKAEQEAEAKRVAQAQVNEATKSQAQTELESVKMKTEAQIAVAEAEKKVAELKADAEKTLILRKAEAEAQAIALKADAEKKSMDLKGKALSDSPALLQLSMVEVQSKVLANANLTLTSTELAACLGKSNIFTLFGNSNSSRVIEQTSKQNEIKGIGTF